MKPTELREKNREELEKMLDESKSELFNLRFQLATNQLDNTTRIKTVKRQIARIYTTMRIQEIEAWEAMQRGENV